MIFVGRGALLWRAVSYSKRAGLMVDLACCPRGDSSILSLRRSGASVLETDDPNTELLPFLKECSDGIGFSIHNRYILTDRLLTAGVSFFNVHNGLVQQYRGIAEVCIFAALCRGERHYGVTLQELVPNHKVDSGPVIEQLKFDIGIDDGFSEVMTKSLDACEKIFQLNVEKILANDYTAEVVGMSGKAYSYMDVAKLCVEADTDRFARAISFGPYADLFPRLRSIVASAR